MNSRHGPALVRWLTLAVSLSGSVRGATLRLGDLDADGEHTVHDVVRLVNHVRGTTLLPAVQLPLADLNTDGSVNDADVAILTDAVLGTVLPPLLSLSQFETTSPFSGEGSVAVTRETIIRLTKPIANATSVTPQRFFGTFGGQTLTGRIHVGPERRVLTLFFPDLLPPSARVRVTLTGDAILDDAGYAIDPDGDGVPGGTAALDFDTLTLTALEGTAVCGRVFASELDPTGNAGGINTPLGGVTITVDGRETEMRTVTDSIGNFRLDPCPVGKFFVHIDGRTATNGIPPGAYYPLVGKAWTPVPGQETNIGNIYLPLVRPNSLTPVSPGQSTSIGFPAAVLQDFPELAGTTITVPADSLYSDDGSRGGMVGIAPVPPDRLPSALPPGLEFPLVITVQTNGPANFDRPVPLCMPNLPDPVTGLPLLPGQKSALWSFNHDTGRFEVVGPMTVTADGSMVCTDPGVGILAPGWHGIRPGVTASGGPLVSGTRGGPAPGNRAAQQEKPSDPSSIPPACPLPFDLCEWLPYLLGSPSGKESRKVDPVHLFSGEFYHPEVDLRIKGRGLDFIWSRKYRSKIGITSAQGNNWDSSYNVAIRLLGPDIMVSDGNSREDRFVPQPNGRWGSDGFFRELFLNADGSYTMEFEDKGRWVFHPPGTAPNAGKLFRIIDRHGNTLTLFYDAPGRLNRVRDTLDRDILIGYNAQGLISTVTDFVGRVVRYDYYLAGEAGGNPGDLKSVTAPAVTGTPNGNNFPNGKKTSYTYSKGFADARLNGNLLTITDGRRNDSGDPTFGQGPWLVNTYAATTDPADPDFDRVVRQQWGGNADVIDIVYVPLHAYGNIELTAGSTRFTPASGNVLGSPAETGRFDYGPAVMRTIVNDRNGNVSEYFFDEANRLTLQRDYTGRANPNLPTTATTNRPTGKLRGSDPDYFETKHAWNADSRLREVLYPNGNVVRYEYEEDLNPNGPRRGRGNLRTVRRSPGRHLPAGDQAELVEHFEYDTDFACGTCGFNFLTRHIDARGAETRHLYDAKGNRTRTIHRLPSIIEDFEYNEFGQPTAHVLPGNASGSRRRDQFVYHAVGPQRGYLQLRVTDAGGLNLTTAFEHDAVGNLVGIVDPRGHDWLMTVNQLNQIVRLTSPETTTSSGIRYQRDLVYDANNNLVRIDVQNIDHTGVLQANTHFTTTLDFEILNEVTRRTQEVTATKSIVNEFAYDGNRNLILVRKGEAANGQQPQNTISLSYDERDLVFKETLAAGNASQSSTQFGYDGNGNLTERRQGIEGIARLTTFVFDGYDRRMQVTDPSGNQAETHYDANGNLVRALKRGELADQPGAAGNVRLGEIRAVFDALDRVVQTEAEFFDALTQLPLGDGKSITQSVFADTSQVTQLLDDNGRITRFAYDTANRLVATTDAKNNAHAYSYDANGNLTRLTETEKPDLGGADELFSTIIGYDNLNRRTSVIDNIGNTTSFAYDSRNNLVGADDPLGNDIFAVYDGLNRLLETHRVLRANGVGGGAVSGEIITKQEWDDSHRLTAQIDDRGNATRATYDALNRPVAMTWADNTQRTATYDPHHNRITQQDANGTMVTNIYDQLNRIIHRTVAPGAGVSTDTTFEDFAYDGLSRLVRAEDDDSVVAFAYDSLSQVLKETLNGQETRSSYDGVGNRLTCTYPGGRSIGTSYDELNRPRVISDAAGMIGSYFYTGPSRVVRRDLGNGARLSCQYDGITGVANPPGDFGVRQLIRTTHTHPASGTTLDDRTYKWDRMGNKTARQDLVGGEALTMVYDSAYRLVHSARTPAAQAISYVLDDVNNRLSVSGGADSGGYSLSNVLPEPADSQLNEYTTTPFDTRQYDRNGNLRQKSAATTTETFSYDFANRMVAYSNPSTGSTATYGYDALGRRIRKLVTGTAAATTHFFYADWQACEEQDAANVTKATYAFGGYVDEALDMKRGATTSYYTSDDLCSVTALLSSAGAVNERYAYEDFGAPSRVGGSALSPAGNPHFFTGQRHDAESGFSCFRTRYLDSRAGRFTSRDLPGMWHDSNGVGNGYCYVGNNPLKFVDPLGRDSQFGVWIEGPSRHEPAPHISVNIGNPGDFYYNSFSYGTGGTVYTSGDGEIAAPLTGGIYSDEALGGKIFRYLEVPDAATAAAIVAEMRAREQGAASTGWYFPGLSTCRNYSVNEFERIKKQYNLRETSTLPQRPEPRRTWTGMVGGGNRAIKWVSETWVGSAWGWAFGGTVPQPTPQPTTVQPVRPRKILGILSEDLLNPGGNWVREL